MKLVFFPYIYNSFPVRYVLNEITRGLVLVCRMLSFYGILQVTQDHSLFFFYYFVSSLFLEIQSNQSLFYGAMSCSASVGNYFCFSFINKQAKNLPVYATFCFKF